MKKAKKILVIFIVLNAVLFAGCNYSNESYADTSFLESIEGLASGFITRGESEASGVSDTGTLTDNIVGIGQVLTFIGIGVLVCVTSIMGIQFLMAPPEKQGEIKEKLIGVAFATVVIFGAWGIWKIAINIFSKLD